ncbi:unnamed protein product [Cuscuta europaea]|uniref:BAG domain-containing protein n=1 Tax=Cuscuta europaea TaxID=41803 RepID=A0A9P0ZRZ5_CUSEU|nr:unnamed protein product [Cuscuta europaea]
MVRSYTPFGNYFPHSSLNGYTPAASSFPVHEVQNKHVEVSPKPKVVQIPVRFVGSASARSASALKIQRAFRGFLVRRSMNRIISAQREVDEIERKVSQRETVELLRTNERERIRVNENLMSLLFKLDSVRGIYSGIRDCRKSVTRKAIALQERIDSIVNSNIQTVNDGEPGEDEEENVDMESSEVCHSSDSELPESVEQTAFINNSSASVLETGITAEKSESPDGIHVTEPEDIQIDEPNSGENDAKSDSGDDCIEGQRMGGIVPEITPLDAVLSGGVEQSDGKDVVGTSNVEDESKKNRELLERIMEENGKMMSLMTQLSERNETQMIMLDALTQRVEHLEKAFMCDKMRRKKIKKMRSN